MAHAVESMFYVRQPPWHGLGTRVEQAPKSEDALCLAGLDWTVQQAPVMVGGIPVPGHWANIRDKDGSVLGIVKERYRILQNKEAFAFTDGLLGMDVLYETAGSLFGGKRVWILARLKQPIKLLKDETIPYLCITNNHDGEGALRVILTPIRVVCQNTLNLALQKAPRSWSTRHTGNVWSKLDEASRTLELTQNYLGRLQEHADRLSQVKVSEQKWVEAVSTLVPLPKDSDSPLAQLALKRAVQKQKLLVDLFNSPDLKPYKETAWAAVNAVVDYSEHVKWRPPTEKSMESGFARILDDGHPMVEKALGLLGVRI
ncbi:MAG TPA: DUF932 domain-containing protein [Symbiobacteriaceae bacterium]|nr:DUF932 domain-containing protein [Symbiobacteriaceae bacterium]